MVTNLETKKVPYVKPLVVKETRLFDYLGMLGNQRIGETHYRDKDGKMRVCKQCSSCHGCR